MAKIGVKYINLWEADQVHKQGLMLRNSLADYRDMG